MDLASGIGSSLKRLSTACSVFREVLSSSAWSATRSPFSLLSVFWENVVPYPLPSRGEFALDSGAKGLKAVRPISPPIRRLRKQISSLTNRADSASPSPVGNVQPALTWPMGLLRPTSKLVEGCQPRSLSMLSLGTTFG